MRIIHVLKGKANPLSMNGVNKVVHNLATQQHFLGHEVEVWGITNNPESISHKHDYKLKLFKNTKSRFIPSKRLRIALSELFATNTIVHMHSVFLPELLGVSKILNRKNIRWVLTPHSGYHSSSLKKNKAIKSIYIKFFEKQFIGNAEKIHALSSSEAVDIQNLNATSSIVVIPNGQSFEEVAFSPVPSTDPSTQPVFGFCGRLSKEHKGLDLLIKGFSLYKRNGGEGELWLIGDGPDKKYLNQLAATEGVVDSIRFFGQMIGDSKLSTIKRMDVFVHTSRWEGMPMAVLEAIALERPLLISEETNLGDYIREYQNGMVLAENKPHFISRAMFEFYNILGTDKIKKMEKSSIALINEKLNWLNITKYTLTKLYGEAE